ncbi:MAG: hypothetical protein KY459_11065 [Acidobacteria bacterium]|nr:hypothetical protein [Acidobacteriota bacterium]
MSVEEISGLHNRFVQLSDRFKSLWTFHQFAQSVFRNVLERPLPYKIDFQSVWEPIRHTQTQIGTADPEKVSDRLQSGATDLANIAKQLLVADELLTTSVMRRFFEKLGSRDEMILVHLIRFYLASPESLEGDRRDKFDFLVTRLGEAYVDDQGGIGVRDSLNLRERFQAIGSSFEGKLPGQERLLEIIRELKVIREQVEQASRFENLTDSDLIGKLRMLKHECGNALFHPDVMLAAVNANVAMKKRFSELYQIEEQEILNNIQRVIDNEDSLRDGFAREDDAIAELERFRKFKQDFDESRSRSNLKTESIMRMKQSLYRLLGQDRKASEETDVSPVIEKVEERVSLERIFGSDAVLQPYLEKISTALTPWKNRLGPANDLAREVVVDLRLEPWEIAAFFHLYREEGGQTADERERDLLYVRAAALRMRINEDAGKMLKIMKTQGAASEDLGGIRETLGAAETTDSAFGAIMNGAQAQWGPEGVRRLHRSRLRLFREFSGLWLIYDQHVTQNL